MLQTAVVLSFDSLVAGAALGAVVPSGGVRLRLALLFGACDAVASSAGWILFLSPPHWVEPLAPGALAFYAVYLLAAGAAAAARPGLILLLPVLLSLDNLMSPAAPLDALVFGATSAAFAWVGLAIGACAGKGRERGMGAAALAAAALMLAF